jgi:hydroxymethylpyrimidine/phosphomethylpyrimidine kinase
VTARVALTVAGSDPSGGAGIQADLKTFSALGAYGTAVLTALTAQNTRGVTGVHPVPADFVRLQLTTLLDDVTVHATKTGMLGSAAVVRAVAGVLAQRRAGPVVVDPVMVATSGDRLIDDDAVAAVRDELLPVADLLTPNVPEAAALLGTEPATREDELPDRARALLALGPRAVLLKGGHLGGGESVDVLATADGVTVTRRPRIATTATHGTGCTLSSALAALAAQHPGEGWPALVEPARDYLQRALAAGESLGIGSGHGPVHHFAGTWSG